jgi:glucose-6-phosphate isomerase
MFDIFNGAIADAKTLLTAAVAVMAIWFVIWTWVRTRSVVPTVGAVLLGAIVSFGIAQMNTLKDAVNEDVTEYREGGRGG